MRTLTTLSLGASLAILVGCGQPTPVPPPVTSIAAKNAPSWVDNPAIPDGLGAVGIAQPNALGDVDEMRTEAEANARTRLAAMMDIKVQAMTSSVSQQLKTGTTENGKAVTTEVMSKFSEDIKRQILNQNLRGAIVQESYTAPSGSYYVHMVMTKETLERTLRGAATAQIKKELAQGEKGLEHALDKLDSAIAAAEAAPTN